MILYNSENFQFKTFQKCPICEIPKNPIWKIQKNSNSKNSENFQFEKFKKIPIRKILRTANLENSKNFRLENSKNCKYRKFQKFPEFKNFENHQIAETNCSFSKNSWNFSNSTIL